MTLSLIHIFLLFQKLGKWTDSDVKLNSLDKYALQQVTIDCNLASFIYRFMSPSWQLLF